MTCRNPLPVNADEYRPHKHNPQAPWGINPEAPTDGLNDHWEPPPKQSGWWWAIMPILVGLIMLGMIAFAFAHMRDRPELDAWFNGLQSSGGYPCCSSIDGSTISDLDWDTTVIDGKPHYRVRIEGQWVVVSDAEVVNAPNRYGAPIVWLYWINQPDGKPRIPQIRCFMPGAGG
jgi:hypothetical protein